MATTEIYILSLHDALPISRDLMPTSRFSTMSMRPTPWTPARSEEHTSELQSHSDLVCRLLLEKKKHAYHLQHYTLRQPHQGPQFGTPTALSPRHLESPPPK